ncbi:MAG: InlB B-repeat-containing protein, partial [Clostridia bacterium]|nr:InlB B-repeat-containing protein [Clostridia bacterium]
YTVNAVDVNIPESEIKDLENRLVSQAVESGFAEKAASFYLSEKFGVNDAEVGKKYTLTREQVSRLGIEVDGGNLMYQIEIGRPNVSAEITKNLQKITQINKATGLRVAFGVTIPVGLEVVENGWHVVESLTFDLYVTFEQEVAFNAKFSADAKWKWYFIIPVLKEVVADARFEFGTYTGVGAITTASTEKYYKKTYLWTELVEKEDGTKLFSSASNIATKLNEYLKNGDLSFFGDVGGESELVDKYADMLQREIDYFDILALPIFHKKGYFDPKTHIVNYVIDIELIFAAKLNVTMGISFENLDVKEYSFHFELFKGKKSYNVVNKQTPYTNFNFFLFGNLGVRAGVGLTFSVGLISVKLDNIGVHVEVGPYLELYGFYYYHYDKIGNAKPNIKSGGAIYVEIGIYMALDFFAGAFFDLLSVEVHLVDESWKLFGAGTEWYTVALETPKSTVTTYSGDSFTISDKYFDLLEFNILTGERKTKRVAITDFSLAPTTYAGLASGSEGKITYNEQTGKFEVNAELTDLNLTETFKFVYKYGNPLLAPATKTVTVNWVKTDPKFAIQYYTGNIVYSSANNWEGGPQPDDTKTQLILAGSALPSLPNHDSPLPGYDFLGWQIDCPSLPDIHGKMLSDVNYLEGYIMPECNIGLEPIRKARDDTPYTVRHWLESVDGIGEYDLILEEEFIGTSGTSIYNFNFVSEPGVKLDYDKYPYDDIYHYEIDGKPHTYIWWHRIYGDGSTVVNVYYNRETYGVGIHMNNPVFEATDGMQKVYSYNLKMGAAIPDPGYSEIESPYYTFAGWSTSPDGPVEFTTLPETVSAMDRSRIDYYAIWDYEDADVTFNYYLFDPYTKTYPASPAHTEQRPLPIGTSITSSVLYPESTSFEAGRIDKYVARYGGVSDWAIAKGYLGTPGFHHGAVIDVYCSYDFYQFFFNHKVQYIRAGSEITMPEGPEKAGYVFIGWRSSYVGMEDMLYEAGTKYTAERAEYFVPDYKEADDTAYTVNHYYETDTKNEYGTPVTETLYGTTGSKVICDIKGKTGYVSPNAREITILADGSAVLNYYYARKTYEVKLVLDGGRLNGRNAGQYTYGVPFALFADSFLVTKDGYNFIGWYLQGDEDQEIVDPVWINGDVLTSDGDITFVAKWEKTPITYRVEHYIEQLDGSYALQQTDLPTAFIGDTVTAEAASLAGFTHNAEPEGTVAAGTIETTANTVVLKLYYTRNSYTATWYAYDAATVLGTTEFKYGEAVTAPAFTDDSRVGYTFTGWAETGYGTMTAEGLSFNTKDFGGWSANAYTVVFDANKEGTSGTMEAQELTYDARAAHTKNAFTYTGWTFVGWNTAADGSGTAYADQAEVINLAESGSVTLYAQWEEIPSVQYTVEHYFESLDGTEFVLDALKTQSFEAAVGATVTASSITVDGFTFDASNAGNITEGVASASEPLTLKLYYTRNSYTLTVNFNGESIKIAVDDPETFRKVITSQTIEELNIDGIKYGESLAEHLTGLTVSINVGEIWDDAANDYVPVFEDVPFEEAFPGYVFDGWDNETSAMPATDLTVTAKWTPITVKVVLHNGTSSDEDAVVEYYEYGDTVLLPTDHGFVKDGYFISGWKYGSNSAAGMGQGTAISDRLVLVDGFHSYDGINVTEGSGDIPAGEVHLYAGWSSESYECTVTFVANGGTGIMEDQIIDQQNFCAIHANGFVRDGYRFIGWTTEASYDPDTDWLIRDGETYSAGYGTTSVMLYAQWEAIE